MISFRIAPRVEKPLKWKTISSNGVTRTTKLANHIKYEVRVGTHTPSEWREIQHIMKESK
jgi:hypothetical protein